jgi:hypothetical protein
MNVIRYAHYRGMNEKGELQARGGMTVAYVVNDENKVIRSATAYCSTKDNYSRPRGRALASGRLQYKHLSELEGSPDAKVFLTARDNEARTMGLGRKRKPAAPLHVSV